MSKEELKKELEKLKDFKVYAFEWDVYVKAEDYKEIAIENKKLKEEVERLKQNIMQDELEIIPKLEKENKNLNDKIDLLEEEIIILKEKKENLKSDLEQLREAYKEYYDRDKEELMESCYSLAKENDKLKSDLEECECSFWFESDEVWFWKREYKRLKKWIKDHCKWYWNLFPEDEMKRQRKKADKKRK